MSFTKDIKQEVSHKELSKDEAKAELSALIQLTSSLSISHSGLAMVSVTENAAVSRTIYKLCKELYEIEITPSVKRRMNLKKNLIYILRLEGNVKEILTDLGLYSSRGLLEKPLHKIVAKESMARAYLTGAFMAEGSINSPQTTNYHLEIKAASEKHALFLVDVLNTFEIPAKIIDRRNHFVVYVQSAEKIADFLRCIEATNSLLIFEDARISRDFTSNMTRLNNVDVANVVKSMEAARNQLEDIRVLEEYGLLDNLDEKLKDVIELRKENPEASLNELCEEYRIKKGITVSKSGLKHRFVKIHELREKVEKTNEK